MQFEKNEIKKPSLMKSIIEESKKLRDERGRDFYSDKKTSEVTAKIHSSDDVKIEADYRTLRESHIKLTNLVSNYDEKKFEQNDQQLKPKKPRSKSLHLYIDENIEHFLKTESNKSETKWGLRKNAGFGQLIQKFIGNFIELKKREERQLKRVKKVLDEFQLALVTFKKHSINPSEFQATEGANQKMKVLSNDLNILLALLEFEEGALKLCLGDDDFKWIEFILKWKFCS